MTRLRCSADSMSKLRDLVEPYRLGYAAHANRSQLPNSAFAFPKERKEALTDAAHVRNAIAPTGRCNIAAAAKYYGVHFER